MVRFFNFNYLQTVRYHRIYQLSERAITIEWESVIDKNVHNALMGFDKALKENPIKGWIENVPSYHTLTVYYDPIVAGIDVKDEIETRLANFVPIDVMTTRKLKVPVCYDKQYAIDMPIITERLGLSAEDVVRMHCGEVYRVYMIGFMPGFPYMGKINPKLFLERKSVPSTSIPAGSVAIAGFQTGIYPFDSPGGWYVIGKTPLTLFENGHSTFEPGDEISFEPISEKEMKAMAHI